MGLYWRNGNLACIVMYTQCNSMNIDLVFMSTFNNQIIVHTG